MDLKKYESLVRRQTEVSFKLGLQVSNLTNDQAKMLEVAQSVLDGTIDDGDTEDIANRLMALVTGLKEYQDLLDFGRQNVGALAELFTEMGREGPQGYDAYIGLTQRMTQELATRALLESLLASGVVKDRRRKN
jgi:hypothetical protein